MNAMIPADGVTISVDAITTVSSKSDVALPGGNTLECGSHRGAWYCVATERFREKEARDRIEDQGFGVFLPLTLVMRRCRAGILQATAVPIFPGYLFASFNLRRDRWQAIAYTRGVRSVFCAGSGQPVAVPARQMQVLVAKMAESGVITEDPRPALIEAGTKVRVTEGAFADRDGICQLDEDDRVRLLMDIFGRPMEVTVARKSVRPL